MPIEYKVDLERHLIISTAGNRLTKEEFMDYIQQITSYRQTGVFDQLVDLSAVQEVDLPTTKILQSFVKIATRADKPNYVSKLAIVATSDLIFGLSRAYAAYRDMENSSTTKVAILKSLDAAVLFLEDPTNLD